MNGEWNLIFENGNIDRVRLLNDLEQQGEKIRTRGIKRGKTI